MKVLLNNKIKGPTLGRDIPFSGLFLTFYTLLKEKIIIKEHPNFSNLFAGLGAG